MGLLVIALGACAPVALPEPSTSDYAAAFPSCAALPPVVLDLFSSGEAEGDEYFLDDYFDHPPHWVDTPPDLPEYLAWIDSEVARWENDIIADLMGSGDEAEVAMFYRCFHRIILASMGHGGNPFEDLLGESTTP
ncbi:MAG: hypothetical protein OXG09_02810 [Chloroflexi bacterium]|nr:hypothetical protein [Chloroflexota bacterium]